MPAYFIMRVDVHDAEVYERHIGQAVEALKEFGGELLARGGRCEHTTGEGRSRNVLARGGRGSEGANTAPSTGEGRGSRNVLVRFADFATAKAFTADPRVQESLRLTAGACTRDGTIVEGL